jgi:hypothetical protein
MTQRTQMPHSRFVAEIMRDDHDDARDRRSGILDGARAALLRFWFRVREHNRHRDRRGRFSYRSYHYFPGKEDVLS